MIPTLVLASASPRRKELLERVGVPIVVRPADVDETPHAGEAPLAYVARVAAAKTDAALAGLEAEGRAAWVLGADTVVEIDDRTLGKAADPAQALAMLRRLVGRAHRVSTAFCLRGPDGSADRVVTTEVIMRPALDAELADYVSAGEWQGKAGAYAVQGMAAALVTELHGSVTNVMGLPLAEVLEEMARLGAGGPRYVRGTPA
jgi:septum formation protein